MDNQKFYIELDKESILSLPRPEVGEMAYATDTEEYLVYTEEGWQTPNLSEVQENGIRMPVYELERSIAMSKPECDLKLAKQNILALREITKANFYMLYGKECSYFTLFRFNNENWDYFDFSHGVVDCLHDIGKIKYCELTENQDAVEIWVDHEELGATGLYLFPYDNGIVQVRE